MAYLAFVDIRIREKVRKRLEPKLVESRSHGKDEKSDFLLEKVIRNECHGKNWIAAGTAVELQSMDRICKWIALHSRATLIHNPILLFMNS